MAKVYGFKFDRDIDEKQWLLLLTHSFSGNYEVSRIEQGRYFVFSDDNIHATLAQLLPLIENDLTCQIAAIACPATDKLAVAALDLVFKYQKGHLLNLADVCLLAALKNEEEFLSIVNSYFKNVDEELLHTMQVFLLNDHSSVKTAESLFLHRNTLLYRRNKFQQLTRLNLQDFDDAAFFHFWLIWRKVK